MGDMAEVFNDMKAAVKEHRAKMIAQADTTGWTKHSDYHFSRIAGTGALQHHLVHASRGCVMPVRVVNGFE